MRRCRIRVLATLGLFSSLVPLGCVGPPGAGGAGGAEGSVKPGINETFLSEELDVDRYVEVFEGESREVFALRESLSDQLGLEPGQTVADVGAGTGIFVPLFAERVGPEGRVYAVEIAPRFVDHLRERVRREGLAQVSVVEGREHSVALPAASVDVAWLCDTYHHFEYPRSTLASLMQAIRSGGSLFVVDFERIPGETSDWLLNHVRAGKEVFSAEIERAGFVLVEEIEAGLEQNYMLRFERP